MTTGPYYTGTLVEMDATFTNLAGAAADPTAVTCTVTKPDGTTATPTATSTVVGSWSATVTADQVGIWEYVFAGTGAVQVGAEKQFQVID